MNANPISKPKGIALSKNKWIASLKMRSMRKGKSGRYEPDPDDKVYLILHFGKKKKSSSKPDILFNMFIESKLRINGKIVIRKRLIPIGRGEIARMLTVSHKITPIHYDDKMAYQSYNPQYVDKLHPRNPLRIWVEAYRARRGKKGERKPNGTTD